MSEQVGRTAGEGVRELNRREQLAEMRRLHRRMSRRGGYAKMLAAAFVAGWIGGYGLMIVVGILHAWWHTIPTMGFGRAIVISDVLVVTIAAIIVVIQTARELS